MAIHPGIHIRRTFFALIILAGSVSALRAQEEITGVVNVYRKVTAVATSPPDNVTLDDVSSVSQGDTILLIQMQGVKIQTDNGVFGLLYLDKYGTPGAYEFLLVSTVDAGAKKVYFTRYMQNVYDARGNVQLIKVPYYDRAKVKGKLTADPWDATKGTGGVLAMIVGSKLEIDSQDGEIDVSGLGFSGGADTAGIADCIDNDYASYSLDAYSRSWQNAGYKGEGASNYDLNDNKLYPSFAKGQGPTLTGGGGGNGKYSGGGGGSNRGAGSDGAREMSPSDGGCPAPLDGGKGGGKAGLNTFYAEGVFVGGGGGASTRASGAGVSPGGNGGGIVIILTDTLSGNRRSIKANGASAANVTGNAGAGGGGAGGSVVLSLRSFSKTANDTLKISVRGGNGGFRADSWGTGGGGGGGLLALSMTNVPGKIKIDTTYGAPVDNVPDKDGYYGDLVFNVIPKVNGFLFNAIRSEVTGTQTDSICSNTAFGKIVGTVPVGGQGPYNYQWLKSTVSESGPWTTIPGANSIDYSPGLLTQTTWFQRIVTDNSTPVITDNSIPVKVIVQQAITGNVIGRDTTICFNQDPLSLVPLNSGPSNGNGIYSYKWLKNTTDVPVWDSTMSASGAAFRGSSYDPPALSATTYYKRLAVSGRCIDYSGTTAITVLPSISNNVINNPTDQAVCQPATFANITGSNPAGGNNIYTYTWQQSKDRKSWQPVAGLSGPNPGNTNIECDPKETPLSNRKRDTTYIRRLIYSGPYNTCADSTAAVRFINYPKISNNIIRTAAGADITGPLCQSPASSLVLSGSSPAGGDSIYVYTWKHSLTGSRKNLGDWTNDGSGQNYSGAAPPDSLYYSRLVVSASGLCTDTTVARQEVLVHRVPLARPGTNAEICGATVTLRATPDVGSDEGTGWLFNLNGPDLAYHSSELNPVATVKADSSFFSNRASKDISFWWKEVNGLCRDSAAVKISFFTRVSELGPNRDTALYSFDGILHMNAAALVEDSGETGLWTTISGSDQISGETEPDARVGNLGNGLNSYRWTVSNKNQGGNAICTDSYIYNVNVYNVFIPNVFSPNGDGLYDDFYVRGLDLDNQRAELRIINSAGTEVFHTSNINGETWRNWDGNDPGGSALPEGTYYYLLKMISWGFDGQYDTSDDQAFQKSGFIVLRRYSSGNK